MWKNKNVWILLIGEFIAGLGLWTGIIGNLEFMQGLVPSDFAKSLILFAGLLAGVMVGPLAGRIIDATSKKKVMLVAGFGRMISVVFMFLAIEYQSILLMIVFMIAIQISAAFYFPALQSSIPLIVKEKELLEMNGVHMNVSTISRIAGTALAGAMLVVMSLPSLYLASMIAYGLLFALTFLLEINEEPRENDSKTIGKSGSFKEVLPVLKSTPIAMTVLILTFIPILFIGGFNLMVINISEIQNDQVIKSWIYTIEGIFFMIGAFSVKRITNEQKMVPMLFAFVTLIAISLFSLYFADLKWMTLFAFGLFGLAVGCFFPLAATIFQTKIPKEFHGRFFSFRNMLDRVLFQVALLGTGLLLDTIGLQYMGITFGFLSLFIIFSYGLRLLRQPMAISEQKTP
ncbi:2-acyl-glycerophospho-ethanolamine acyltransferase [Bacillus sp. THAF10]|uniref:MFS transporter n=1 Tax=Bacillus sp. THAF10 TaxID=2587848 RepID=UPI00126822EC|nr:MFS transporter [Bacillus sp. THAF10]QFT89190.1 2-acyl-glycerophospho-ethanolamine acyltransferase [Bacillus sp. THAF10]